MRNERDGRLVAKIDLLDEFRFAYESVLEGEEVELELHVRFERVRQWKLKVSTFDHFHRTEVDFVRRCIWFVLPLSSNRRG